MVAFSPLSVTLPPALGASLMFSVNTFGVCIVYCSFLLTLSHRVSHEGKGSVGQEGKLRPVVPPQPPDSSFARTPSGSVSVRGLGLHLAGSPRPPPADPCCSSRASRVTHPGHCSCKSVGRRFTLQKQSPVPQLTQPQGQTLVPEAKAVRAVLGGCSV